MSSLLECEVINVPFAFLGGLNVQRTKLRSPLVIQDTVLSTFTASIQCHILCTYSRKEHLMDLTTEVGLPVEVHKLLDEFLTGTQSGEHTVCLSLCFHLTIRTVHVRACVSHSDLENGISNSRIFSTSVKKFPVEFHKLLDEFMTQTQSSEYVVCFSR